MTVQYCQILHLRPLLKAIGLKKQCYSPKYEAGYKIWQNQTVYAQKQDEARLQWQFISYNITQLLRQQSFQISEVTWLGFST